MQKISLAIPTHNRFDLALKSFAQVLEDPRIGEIVLSDDASTDGSYARLQAHFRGHPKVRLFQNTQNRDCYANKELAVTRCVLPWAILFDDDNVLSPAYLDVLEREYPWHEEVLYCPEFAEPHFNYTAFSGEVVSKQNLQSFVHRPHFKTALNTANNFFLRQNYIGVHDKTRNPHTSDSIYMAYLWLKAGLKIKIVPGLRYFHRVHDGSHYKANHHKTGGFAQEVEHALTTL